MVFYTPLIKAYAWYPRKIKGERIWKKTYYYETWDAEDAGQVISGYNDYTEEEATLLILKGEKEVNNNLLPFHNFVMWITSTKTIVFGGLAVVFAKNLFF